MMSEEKAAGEVLEQERGGDNVIHVKFGSARTAPSTPEEPTAPFYDVDTFESDPVALKKLDIFTEFVDAGMVSVTMDSTAPGVSVPPQFRGRPELVLNFSLRFYIEDFTYDEHAICASLSFSGSPYYCIIPWGAVKILLSHSDNRVAVFDASLI